MADAPIVVAAQRFKADLLTREEGYLSELVRIWLALMEPLELEVDLLAMEFAARKARGDAITEGALFRLDRYQAILGQAKARTEAFNGRAEKMIEGGQRSMAEIAIEHSTEAIRTAGIVAGFDRLPVAAVNAMIGVAGDGQPLGKLLAKNFGEVGAKFGTRMVTGTALGWNPRKTARASAKALEIPLQRAMVTTRTEQNRVYRETTRASYQRSQVVQAQMRLSARDTRVCAACLMADGMILPLGKALPEHPQGRCTSVPIVVGEEPPAYLKGREWFLTLGEKDQREILGDGRYEAWREKRFDLPQLVGVRQSEEWGESLYVPSLADLTEAA
ncbi:MAG: hypothetical protein ACO1SV_12315 [Fimbriimonas sp.]